MGEIDILSIRSAFDTTSWYSELSTIAVTAGVFIEFLALFIFSRDMPPKEKVVMIFATLLIVAGCGGEFIFGSRASDAAAQLQRASDQQVALLKAEIARLSTAADQARAEIAKSNASAKEADDHAASTQLELTKLQSQLSWREFPVPKQIELASVARQFSHPITSKVIFDSVVGNPEAKRYGALLAKALSDGIGAPIDAPMGLSSCVECAGVWVCINENAEAATSEDGKAIRGAFELVGVTGTKFCTDPKNGLESPMTVKVIVGPKE